MLVCFVFFFGVESCEKYGVFVELYFGEYVSCFVLQSLEVVDFDVELFVYFEVFDGEVEYLLQYVLVFGICCCCVVVDGMVDGIVSVVFGVEQGVGVDGDVFEFEECCVVVVYVGDWSCVYIGGVVWYDEQVEVFVVELVVVGMCYDDVGVCGVIVEDLYFFVVEDEVVVVF